MRWKIQQKIEFKFQASYFDIHLSYVSSSADGRHLIGVENQSGKILHWDLQVNPNLEFQNKSVALRDKTWVKAHTESTRS